MPGRCSGGAHQYGDPGSRISVGLVHLAEVFVTAGGIKVPRSLIGRVIDAVPEDALEWQEPTALAGSSNDHVRRVAGQDSRWGSLVNKAIDFALALTLDRERKVLGMRVEQTEAPCSGSR